MKGSEEELLMVVADELEVVENKVEYKKMVESGEKGEACGEEVAWQIFERCGGEGFRQ